MTERKPASTERVWNSVGAGFLYILHFNRKYQYEISVPCYGTDIAVKGVRCTLELTGKSYGEYFFHKICHKTIALYMKYI